mmetsp:Transcript_167/g.685  ORF Transcript_167/g.685 Transcript_167/m.685 type:complete len:135 (+) Transcript_167:204-608(+)
MSATLRAVLFLALSLSTLAGEVGGVILAEVSAHMHETDDYLHSHMRAMMDDDEDDDIETRLKPKSGLLQAGAPEKDPYLAEAEDGLSAALGPRWNGKKLDEDANSKTQALLRGISGGNTVGALHGMMDMMTSIR